MTPPSLFPYQEPAAEALVKALSTHHYALDASDTGTGKTVVACEVVRRLGMFPFVICPKAVIPSWKKWLSAFGIPQSVVINFERLRYGNTPYLQKTGHARHKSVVWVLPANVLVIVDEAHRASGMHSWNANMVGYLKAYQIPTLLLSATLAESPLKLRAPGYLLGLHRWKDYKLWLRQNGCFRDGCNRWRFNPGTKGAEVLASIHHSIFPDKGHRIAIADLGDAFPECATFAEAYDLGEEACSRIDRAYLEQETVIDEATGGTRQPSAIECLLRGRQMAENLKVPMLVEMTQDLLEENNSVVVAFNFRESFATFCEAFPDCAWIRGDQSGTTREAQIQRFQRDETRVIAVMIQAGGVGISLHDLNGKYPRVALICPTWNAVELKQMLGRIHRASAKSKAINRIVFAAGTVEERACESAQRKLTNIQLLNDGDLSAGLPYEINTEGIG